eukprot:scaffold45194_cov56-Attheya_sp.AAC.1
MSAFPVSPLSRCFSCKKRIHTDCVTSTRPNPRTKWKMSSAAGGHEWPGSTLQFCPACHVINNAYTQNENEFIKPYETSMDKLILCGFKPGTGVWEKPEMLQTIKLGQEQMVYSLVEVPDQKFYEEIINRVVNRFFKSGSQKLKYTKKQVETGKKKRKPPRVPAFLPKRWVVFEEPTAIILPDEGPNCGPITCLE